MGDASDARTQRWRVRRRWSRRPVPRWNPRGRLPARLLDIVDAGSWTALLDDSPVFALVVLTVLAVLAVVALAVILVPLLLTLVLLLVVFVPLLVAGVVARVAFGRPWRIEAVRGDEMLAWDVAGWRESRLALDELRRSVRLTGQPRTTRGRPAP